MDKRFFAAFAVALFFLGVCVGIFVGFRGGSSACEAEVARLSGLLHQPRMVGWPQPRVNWSLLPEVSP